MVRHRTISVVMPTCGVAMYLPEFLASIDRQRSGLDDVEFIFVDDGSPDDSAQIIDNWLAQRPTLDARLVRKPNGGLSSARNAGLDVATGDWVTFPDPDDILSDDYLGVMSRFVNSPEAERVHIVAGRFIYFNEDDRSHSDTHPLRARFRDGNRIVDLGRHPHLFHVAANTGLFRRDVLNRHGLRYDGTVVPVWEDGHLSARYLSKFERPRIAMMADAIYYYRRRSAGTSLMDGQWLKAGKFLAVPRNGWLDALRTAADEHGGQVPPWIQNMVLYDMMGYFKEERRSPSPTANTPREVSDEFFSILRECFDYIDLEQLDNFRLNYVSPEIRQVLRMTFKDVDPRPAEIAIDQLDGARGIVRLHYFYAGDAPIEHFQASGYAVAPVYAKTRPCRFYGRVLITERVVWLSARGTIGMTLDGRAVPLRTGPIHTPQTTIGPEQLWPELAGVRMPAPSTPERPGLRPRLARLQREFYAWAARLAGPRGRLRTEAQLTVRLSRTTWARRRFKDAWLLIDRDTQAQDNAEHLFRWLRAHRPKVNAFFVLSRTSPDWARLSAEGFRLIDHGSREHHVALLNAKHVVSSQIDNYITEPLSPKLYGEDVVGRWHYTFLQHGVTKDDLSIWINPKPIDLMLTATPDEYHSIVDDGSPYIWSDREIKLTGFPRHDRLLELARGPEGAEPKLILVMPTWRRSLVLDSVTGGNDRGLRHDFWNTRYALEWRAVLESEQLHRAAEKHGYEIVFVPHPNMQGYLDNSPLPEWVQVRRFSEIDIQALLARAVMLVTDYSSMGFEMAYLERPVVYFQFDQHDFFSGGHAYRRGSWSYEDDGFGPVTVDADEAIAAIHEIVERGGTAEPLYAKRMETTFPLRDGRCAERSYEAVVGITSPLSSDELYRKLETPELLAGRDVTRELDVDDLAGEIMDDTADGLPDVGVVEFGSADAVVAEDPDRG